MTAVPSATAVPSMLADDLTLRVPVDVTWRPSPM